VKQLNLRVVAASVGAAAVLVSVGVRAAGDPAPAPVFTDQQVSAGKAAYAKVCAGCHMPDLSGDNEAPPLAGMVFVDTWRTRTTKDLYEYLSAEMPRGGAPQDKETYLSLTAFILQSNGAVAGQERFTPSIAVPIGEVTPARTTGP
jgi:mono/diheme cytochrome c family protein